MQKLDFETYQKRFRDFEILLKFSETHVFRGTIRHQEPITLSPPLTETNKHSQTTLYIYRVMHSIFFFTNCTFQRDKRLRNFSSICRDT